MPSRSPTIRNLFNTLVAVLGLNSALAADRPWLRITVPLAAEAAAGFQSPPPENGMTLWWGWDGPLGTPAAQIGVVMPTTSLWLGDTASDKSNLAIAQKLLETQRDFDWVDERSLASVLKLEGSGLKNLSGQSYRAILVPSLRAISQAALDRLQAFAKAGGRVIFLGRTPTMVTDKTFLKAAAAPDLKWALVESSGEFSARVLEALPKPDVTLDQPCPPVKYQHRSWRDADLYFFFNEGTDKQSCQARLTGTGQAQTWDAVSGRIETLAGAISENGAARVPLVLEAHESKFILVGPPPSRTADGR